MASSPLPCCLAMAAAELVHLGARDAAATAPVVGHARLCRLPPRPWAAVERVVAVPAPAGGGPVSRRRGKGAGA